MFGLGLPELVVIFLAILLLFGAKALPEVARSLGQAVNIFKREVQNIKKGFDDETAGSDTKISKSPEDGKDQNSIKDSESSPS